MPNDDDSYAAEVIRVVAELTKRTEAMTQQLAKSIVHADGERDKLSASVSGTVEAMRKDVYRTIISLQLNDSQHRDEHSADRKERAADAIDRLNRQLTMNLWMGALTALVVINLLLIGFVVVQVAQVLYGR